MRGLESLTIAINTINLYSVNYLKLAFCCILAFVYIYMYIYIYIYIYILRSAILLLSAVLLLFSYLYINKVIKFWPLALTVKVEREKKGLKFTRVHGIMSKDDLLPPTWKTR